MSGETFSYSAFGLSLRSELELPGLPAGSGAPQVLVRFGRVTPTLRKADDHSQYMFNTLSGHFEIREGREIVVEPLPDVSPVTLRIVVLGLALAYLLRQRGWLPLHASGIEMNGAAAIFFGSSGAGKSTTAASLMARGGCVLTDDVAAVRIVDDECQVLCAWPHVRLAQESLSLVPPGAFERHFDGDKYIVRPPPTFTNTDPVRVKRLYLLQFGDSFEITNLPATHGTALLSHHSFVKQQWLEAGALQNHLRQCAAVAQATGVRWIVRPKSFDTALRVAEMVESEMFSPG